MDRFNIREVGFLILVRFLVACTPSPTTQVPGACLHHDGVLRAGFAAVDVSPQSFDTYIDADGDQTYDVGEEKIDRDGDGVWEPLWIAGFGLGRAALAQHDPLWARTLALERDGVVLTFTVIDAVGMLPRRVGQIRLLVQEAVGACWRLKDENIVIATTHTHEAPDLMGIWGETVAVPGVSQWWAAQVVTGAAESIRRALAALQPVDVKFAAPLADPDINDDSREPIVIDNVIHAAQFLDKAGETVGTLVEFSMHPEVLWSQNTSITSDYPHFVRQRMEAKLGGVSVFATGIIGGLMTPRSDVHTFDEAASVGTRIADKAIEALASAPTHTNCAFHTNAARVMLPMTNPLFKIMLKNRVLDASPDELVYTQPYCKPNGCVEEYVVTANLCDVAQFATVPGELFPELALGGYAKSSYYKGTFPDAPTETPIRAVLMTKEFRFIFGLANAEFGYIIPKSQWDPNDYEETVSLGPDTAPILVQKLGEVLAPLR